MATIGILDDANCKHDRRSSKTMEIRYHRPFVMSFCYAPSQHRTLNSLFRALRPVLGTDSTVHAPVRSVRRHHNRTHSFFFFEPPFLPFFLPVFPDKSFFDSSLFNALPSSSSYYEPPFSFLPPDWDFSCLVLDPLESYDGYSY